MALAIIKCGGSQLVHNNETHIPTHTADKLKKKFTTDKDCLSKMSSLAQLQC